MNVGSIRATPQYTPAQNTISLEAMASVLAARTDLRDAAAPALQYVTPARAPQPEQVPADAARGVVDVYL